MMSLKTQAPEAQSPPHLAGGGDASCSRRGDVGGLDRRVSELVSLCPPILILRAFVQTARKLLLKARSVPGTHVIWGAKNGIQDLMGIVSSRHAGSDCALSVAARWCTQGR